MFADEIVVNAGLLGAFIVFFFSVLLGIFGWVLKNAVKLSESATRLEGQLDDHERRIARLEEGKRLGG